MDNTEFQVFRQSCILQHDTLLKQLSGITEKLEEMSNRPMDFTVKVINGTTHERLASELLGEMYVEVKKLKEEKISKRLNNMLDLWVKISAVVGVIAAIFVAFYK